MKTTKTHNGIAFFLSFLISTTAFGTELHPGDLAIVSVSANEPKSFEALLLEPITAGTKIYFTDAAWIQTDNNFREGEGHLCYTAPEDLDPGTILSWEKDAPNFEKSGSFELSGSGDNLICYQITDLLSFIYGVGWAKNTKGNWEYSSSSTGKTSTSDIPPGISIEQYTVTYLGNLDSYAYADESIHSGSKSELLYALSQNTNFTGNDDLSLTIEEGSFSLNGSNSEDKTATSTGKVTTGDSNDSEPNTEVLICPDGSIPQQTITDNLYYDKNLTAAYQASNWQNSDTVLYSSNGTIAAKAIAQIELGLVEHDTELLTSNSNVGMWYKDGEMLGQSARCAINSSGTYQYKQLDENGCEQTSAKFSIKLMYTEIPEIGDDQLYQSIDILGRESDYGQRYFYVPAN